MKKLISIGFCVLSLGVFAAWERVGTIQVADAAGQTAAVTKLGQLVGNPMASAALAAALADNDFVKFFGPARPQASAVFSLFMDAQRLAAEPAKAAESLEWAVLYPVSLSKADFIARHQGSSEKAGAVVVTDRAFVEKVTGPTYVVFSADGKWAAASDKIEQARLALADVATAMKSLDGDLVRLRVGASAMKAVTASVKSAEDADPSVVDLVGQLTSVVFGLRVNDLGVDLRGSVGLADGSQLALCGRKTLGSNPLAFAGKTAISADARAEDAGSDAASFDEDWNVATELLKKHGLDILSYVAPERFAGGVRFTLDLAAILKEANGGKDGAFAKIDIEKLLSDFAALRKPEKKFTAKAPAWSSAVCIKGFESQWTAAERFAATLPEASSKQPFAVSFFSVSSVFKACVPHVAAFIPAEQRQALQPVLDQFGAESKCGIAAMAWNEKNSMRCILRISADEIKGLGNIIMSAYTMFMMGSMSAPAAPAAQPSVDIKE